MRHLNWVLRAITLLAGWFGENHKRVSESNLEIRATYDSAKQNFEFLIMSLGQLYRLNHIENEDFQRILEYLRGLPRTR